MKKSIFFYFFTSIVLFSCSDDPGSQINAVIEEIKTKYAPDKRVAWFEVQWENETLKGDTNMPQAHGELVQKLDELGVPYFNEVNLLPTSDLEGKTHGIVTISVANIRSEARHSAELATQATLGTPLNVLKKEGSWYLIQTPDQYISWVDAAGITLKTQKEMEDWYASQKVVFTDLTGYVYGDPNERSFVSDLTAGNILELTGEEDGFYKVRLPDGRKGYGKKSTMVTFEEWAESRSTSSENLIQTAKNMMGVPYLWGGTSIKGVDCSGFTKTIFFLNGKIIPRDASQQIREGKEIDSNKNWEALEVGDLLFFGVPATDTEPERVIHVGMWIGDNAFIHSRGRVRISSFDPESEYYDEYELNRYLRTKRIVGINSPNVLSVEKIIY